MNVRAALRGICCPIRWEFEEERLSSIMWLSTSFSLLKVPSQSSHLCAVSPVQSVGNLRLARTRVCQMFPFTSYNPLAHHQSTNLNCHVNTFFAPPRKIFTFRKNSVERSQFFIKGAKNQTIINSQQSPPSSIAWCKGSWWKNSFYFLQFWRGTFHKGRVRQGGRGVFSPLCHYLAN